ncbi:MAG: hypothetical protein KGD60_02290 [Candidatus Thorarchaeota archaeon]|nr:hypothetical protein [Candidatus Thorarchaeota archaeon]
MKTVGYFDGTDSSLLTILAASGFCTLPLGNEWDNHGKIASHLQPGEVDIIIAYLHKLLPTSKDVERPIPIPLNLLYPAKTYNIPVLVVVPKDFHEKAENLLGKAADFVNIVTPEDLEENVRKILDF